LDNIQNSKAFEELNFGYYTEYEFNNRTRGLRDSVELAVMHLNVRSLNCNHRALCQFMELLALKFDVIILSEIWSTNINFYHNIIKGYTFFYELPKETHIGGIGVFISNDFSHLERNESKIPSMQIVLKIFGIKLPKMAKNMSLVVYIDTLTRMFRILQPIWTLFLQNYHVGHCHVL